MRCSETLYLSYGIASAAKKKTAAAESARLWGLQNRRKNKRTKERECRDPASVFQSRLLSVSRDENDWRLSDSAGNFVLAFSLLIDQICVKWAFLRQNTHVWETGREEEKKNNMELMSDVELLQDNDTMRHNNDEQ